MNNDLNQFSEERLKQLASGKYAGTGLGIQNREVSPLARIALSVKQAKPVAWTSQSNLDAVALEIPNNLEFMSGDKGVYKKPVPLYTTLQPAHTEQDGWIKCSDDLPDETEDADGGATGYLVRYENDRVPNGGFNIDVSNCVFLRTHWRGLYTHWMPMPAAPKPESE